MSDDSEKTEEPTGKKLGDARQKGQVPLSREVSNVTMLLGAMVLIGPLAPTIMSDLAASLQVFLAMPHQTVVDSAGFRSTAVRVALVLGKALVLPLAMFLFLGIVATLGQIGFLVAPARMKPKLSALSPKAGVKKLASLRNVTEFVKGLVKIAAVGAVAFLVLGPALPTVELLSGAPPTVALERIQDLSLHLLGGVFAVALVLTAADVAYQRYDFHKKMRMTKQEVKDEHKQMEGDPKVKGRIRQIRMERARRRMMAQVPTADVVVTNPTHFAVAMKYDPPKMAAPIVVAKGTDLVAFNIREIAKENGIPIVENPPLARALHATCELDQEVPPEHYRAVAEVISYIFRLRNRRMPD